MKQFQPDQFHVRQLLSYLLSGLSRSHTAEGNVSEKRLSSNGARTTSGGLPGSGLLTGTLEEVPEASQRRWPSRYY